MTEPSTDEREAVAERVARHLVPDLNTSLARGEGALSIALSTLATEAIQDVYADCGDSDPHVLGSNIGQALAFRLPDAILAARPAVDVEDGVSLIAAERQRQIDVEGYTFKHDDGHGDALALAASCYATPERYRPGAPRLGQSGLPNLWPWGPEHWGPTPDDRVRELVKAGALIAAEIDRLNRSEVSRDR